MEMVVLFSLVLLALGTLTQKVAVTVGVATDLLIYGPLMMLIGTVGLAVAVVGYLFTLAA